jgi:hypothetical protein
LDIGYGYGVEVVSVLVLRKEERIQGHTEQSSNEIISIWIIGKIFVQRGLQDANEEAAADGGAKGAGESAEGVQEGGGDEVS